MATDQRIEIRCGNCGYWMPAPAPEDAAHPATAASLLGVVVQCRKCLKRSACGPDNMRAWDVPEAS
jgi:hypothetical protein